MKAAARGAHADNSRTTRSPIFELMSKFTLTIDFPLEEMFLAAERADYRDETTEFLRMCGYESDYNLVALDDIKVHILTNFCQAANPYDNCVDAQLLLTGLWLTDDVYDDSEVSLESKVDLSTALKRVINREKRPHGALERFWDRYFDRVTTRDPVVSECIKYYLFAYLDAAILLESFVGDTPSPDRFLQTRIKEGGIIVSIVSGTVGRGFAHTVIEDDPYLRRALDLATEHVVLVNDLMSYQRDRAGRKINYIDVLAADGRRPVAEVFDDILRRANELAVELLELRYRCFLDKPGRELTPDHRYIWDVTMRWPIANPLWSMLSNRYRSSDSPVFIMREASNDSFVNDFKSVYRA